MVLAAMLAAGLSGCGPPAAATFGNSYDECILKNLRAIPAEAEPMAVRSCQRRFERPSSLRLIVRSVSLDRKGSNTGFIAEVSNSSAALVTRLNIQVAAYQAAPDPNPRPESPPGMVARDGWDFDAHLEPGQTAAFTGTLGPGFQPPARVLATAHAVRAIGFR